MLVSLTVAEVGSGRDYKVYLDGDNFLPYLTGEVDKGPRDEFFYFSDDGDLTALRRRDWKFIFMEQKEYASLRAWLIIDMARDWARAYTGQR